MRNVPTWMRDIEASQGSGSFRVATDDRVRANDVLFLLSIIDAAHVCSTRPLSPPHGETGASRAIDSALSHCGCKPSTHRNATCPSSTNSQLIPRKWGPLGSVTTPCCLDNTTHPRPVLLLLLLLLFLSFCPAVHGELFLSTLSGRSTLLRHSM